MAHLSKAMFAGGDLRPVENIKSHVNRTTSSIVCQQWPVVIRLVFSSAPNTWPKLCVPCDNSLTWTARWHDHRTLRRLTQGSFARQPNRLVRFSGAVSALHGADLSSSAVTTTRMRRQAPHRISLDKSLPNLDPEWNAMVQCSQVHSLTIV